MKMSDVVERQPRQPKAVLAVMLPTVMVVLAVK
jgi:hypothetical protein